ncbi:hypothetical protein N0V86_005695 [Didymella sp. IMI 355093]|nr:hypothetical protein N0V86_005695 [Didymella sp. IMI 355093]
MAPIVLQDELINDASNDNPVVGLKGSLSLKDRFKFCLSRMLGKPVVIPEATDSETLHIYIRSRSGSTSSTTAIDDRTCKFIGELQDGLRKIAWCSNESKRKPPLRIAKLTSSDPQKEEASQDQSDTILVHVSKYTQDIIMKLQQTFNEHRTKYEAVVTQTMGLDDIDEFGSSLDTDLGDLIVTLQQLANSYDSSVRQQNELIEFSWDLLQHCPAADVRFRSLLGSVFSKKLYDLVCQLSHPLSTRHTMIRTASMFSMFRAVNIHLGSPPPARRAIRSPLKISNPPQQPQAPQLCRSSPPSCNVTSLQGTMMDIIRRYLPKEDHGFGLLRLQPASKQAAALLIGCVQHHVLIPPGSDMYYLFGFTTCRTKKEEDGLANYYRQLLKTGIEPTIVFASINKALEHGTLSGLLRNKAGQNLDKYFPTLQQFLAAQLEKRFSVHRLVQSVRDEDNDEPLPCLKRDYGFKFCTQREHVGKLKALYVKIIDNAGPDRLHYACTFGRLLDHAIGILGFVELSMRRLLQNDYPNPAVGYDNTQSLEKYTMPLFKRALRG